MKVWKVIAVPIIKSKEVGVHDVMENFLRGQINILFSFITMIKFLESRENKIKISFELFSFLQGLRNIPNYQFGELYFQSRH